MTEQNVKCNLCIVYDHDDTEKCKKKINFENMWTCKYIAYIAKYMYPLYYIQYMYVSYTYNFYSFFFFFY